MLAVLVVSGAVWLTVERPQEARAAAFSVNLLTDVADLGDTVAPFGSFDPGDVSDGVCDTDGVTGGSQCTLRAAIFEANANGDTVDTITFGTLSGTITLSAAAGFTTLFVGSAPPVGDGLSNGTTIDGNGSVTVACAAAFTGFTVTSAGNTIRDLSIIGCTFATVITGEAADNNFFRGNRVGLTFGNAPAGNTLDSVVVAAGADNNTIGGTLAADQNIISNAGLTGVWITGASTTLNSVVGNLIGVDATGTADFGNTTSGVRIDLGATSNIVGGTTAGSRNIISGNDVDGVLITGAGTDMNVVTGNCIGTQIDCATPRPNTAAGVAIGGGAADNFVGTNTAGSGNVIASNLGAGVSVSGGAATDDNMVSRNSMSGNGSCGIDLVAAENDGLGSGPAITSIVFNGGTSFTISGAGATPGGTVQAFISSADAPSPCPASGPPLLLSTGEGSCFVGQGPVDGAGSYSISVNNIGGASIVLTETNTTNSTSEFGLPAGAPAGPGPGTCPLPAGPAAPTATPTNTVAATSTTAPPAATSTPTRTATPTGPTATPTSRPRESISLSAGCNLRGFMPYYANGTQLSVIAGDIAGGNPRLWFQKDTTAFDLFDPRSAERSTVTTLSKEAGYICVDSATTWSRPRA